MIRFAPVSAWRMGLAGLLITLLLAGCDRETADTLRSAAPSEPVPVRIVRVSIKPTQRTVDVIGTLLGDEETTVSAKVAGRIAGVLKDIGDRAAAGEVLVRIDPIDYDLIVKQKQLAVQEVLAKLNLRDFPPPDFDAREVPTVQKARLQAENARGKLARGKQLHDQSPPLLSDQDFADLDTAAAVAESGYQVELLNARALLAEASSRRADLELARQQLADATVYVPHATTALSGNAPATRPTENSWTVTARMVSIGEYVKEGTPLFRLVDDDPIRLRASVPERFVAQIAKGQKVLVTIEGYADVFEGVVTRINAQIDPANLTFLIEAQIPNADRRLRPGAFAKASIQTRVDSKVVFAPEAAVQSFAGVTRVYLIRDGKALERTIDVGRKTDGWYEVRRGLDANDEIVVEGVNHLASGLPVTVTRD